VARIIPLDGAGGIAALPECSCPRCRARELVEKYSGSLRKIQTPAQEDSWQLSVGRLSMGK
jgi:hypothetical protein